MTMISPEERAEMRDSFARLLADHGSETHVRAAMATTRGYDPDLWKKMADLGVHGLVVDPEYEGIGGGAEEVEALMEVAGAHLLCGPFLVSSILGAALLSASRDATLKADLLPKIAHGDLIVSVAVASEQGLWTLDDIGVSATRGEGAWRLNGASSFVLHGQNADILLVLASTADGVGIFVVKPDTAGLKISGQPTNDPTLRIAHMTFRNVRGEALDGVSASDIEQALALAQVGLAGEQAGGARHIFDITVEYLKTRHQFGRPIGGFQAVKHMAADMLIDVESAVSAARQAASAMATGSNDASQLVALAGFACADAFRDVSAEAIQLHGGIAYTTEHPAHLYWRRARTDLWLFGSSDQHRETYLSLQEAAA